METAAVPDAIVAEMSVIKPDTTPHPSREGSSGRVSSQASSVKERGANEEREVKDVSHLFPNVPVPSAVPLVPLMAFMNGGVSLDGLSVRVNTSAVTSDLLAAKAPMMETPKTERLAHARVAATQPASRASGAEVSTNTADGGASVPPHGSRSRSKQEGSGEAGDGDDWKAEAVRIDSALGATNNALPSLVDEDGEMGIVVASPSSSPERLPAIVADDNVAVASTSSAALAKGLPSRYGGVEGDNNTHEDSVQIDRGSVASPMPMMYTPIFGHEGGNNDSKRSSGLDHTTNAAAAALKLMAGGVSSKATNTTTGSDNTTNTTAAGRQSSSTVRPGGRGSEVPLTPTGVVGGGPSILDCLVEDGAEDSAEGHGLANVLGAIAFALHRSTAEGARYAEVVRRLYAVDNPTTRRNKMPLEKLFRCLAKPNAVYEGISLEFLIVEEADDGRTGHLLSAAARAACDAVAYHTAFYSYAAEMLKAKAERRVKAQAKGYQYANGDAIDIPETRPVLVCLRLRRKFFLAEEGEAQQKKAATVAGDTPAIPSKLVTSWSALRCDLEHWAPDANAPMLPLITPEEIIAIAGKRGAKQAVGLGSSQGGEEGSSDVGETSDKDDTTQTDADSSSSDDDDSDDEDGFSSNGSSKGRAKIQESRRIILAGKDFVATKQVHAANPFGGMIYPTLDGLDTGLCDVLVRGLGSPFTLNRIRLPATVLLLLAMIGTFSAILHLAAHNFEACCVAKPDLSDTGDVMCVYNLTMTSAVSEMLLSECENDMCVGNSGRLRSELPWAYLWGSPLSSGRLMVLGIVLSFVALLLSVLVSFFATRPVAVGSHFPRFFIVPYLLQLACGGLLVAGSISLALNYFEPNHVVSDCSIFGEGTQLMALCRSEYDNCDVQFVITFAGTAGEMALPWLCVVSAVLSLLQIVFSIIPPLLQSYIRDAITPAVPDTMIFRVGRYAPDGITEEEVMELQQEIRARWRKERFHKMVKTVVAGEVSRRQDDFVGRSATAKDAAASFKLTSNKASSADQKRSMRLLKAARLLMGANRLMGIKGGMHIHRPDPTLSNNNGCALPLNVQSAVDEIADKVMARVRDGTLTNNYKKSPVKPRGGGGGEKGTNPNNATVWDVLSETTWTVMKEEENSTQGRRFFNIFKNMDSSQMESHVQDDSVQRRVIESIAARLARETLLQGRALPTNASASPSPARQQSNLPIYPPSMMASPTRPHPKPLDHHLYV